VAVDALSYSEYTPPAHSITLASQVPNHGAGRRVRRRLVYFVSWRITNEIYSVTSE
jgi:hypothetical protein